MSPDRASSSDAHESSEIPQVVLYPCSGNTRAGTVDGHVWMAFLGGGEQTGGVFDGWYTRPQARDRYPQTSYRLIWSNSSRMCDTCLDVAFRRK